MEPQVTPAAPAPEAPAPVTPVAPAAPAAPETPPVADPAASKPAPTPEEAADAAAAAEDDEWANARKDQYGEDPAAKKEPKKDEPAKPAEDGKTGKEGEENPDDKKLDAKPGDGDESATKSEPKSAEDLARDARAAARQTAEQTKAVVADVRSKMFADLPTQMVDSDGDPIHTVQDVMNLVNPATGKGFTEEEAYPWLLAAQQKFNENLAATESKITAIAETNMAIKQEADYVNAKYGTILKADTALRDKLWAQFEKTLEKDEATGIITKMPVSLEEFYELALEGRAAPAAAAKPVASPAAAPAAPGTPKPGEPAAPATPDPAKVAADAKAAEDKVKADAETARQQARADRSDIYVAPADPKAVNKEDDEWGKAAKDYYGDRLK